MFPIKKKLYLPRTIYNSWDYSLLKKLHNEMLIIRKINNLLYSKQYYNNYFNRCTYKYKRVETYLSIYSRLFECRSIVSTPETITYTSNITFGSTLNSAQKIIVSPYRLVKNSHLCDIIFYTTKIGKHKIIIELHFFKKKLVFFKQTFPSSIDLNTITTNFKSKYSLGGKDTINLNNSLIMDNNKSFIKIENEVALCIYYFNLNSEFYPYLLEKQKLTQEEKLQKKMILEDKLLQQI